ncbi:MAG: hydantoinase B/oxoprolinase family protein [Chromatiaceae bacterium]|nr:hydantoinase B/oxoprolinase family protein [Chromatiaceae bacterium]MCP5313998.1 hydantoinase B/oxoprolinase family protein [Chromatiaceae bacterium]
MTPAMLNIFASRLDAVCEEMGLVLRNTAFSPNIRDRLDFSCAVFDAAGGLCAQAAHIPVHLGSMAFAMRDIVAGITWRPGDQVILNDPFLGGTHLPDVTVIAPLFVDGGLQAFVVNRAHHADIGATSPGSMPVSVRLEDEGMIIEPVHLVRDGQVDPTVLRRVTGAARNPAESAGDFAAQLAANRAGLARLGALVEGYGSGAFAAGLVELNGYAERLAREALSVLPHGAYRFTDYLDDDGQGQTDIPIKLCLTVSAQGVLADFTGTAAQVRGNVNCPLAVAAAAVYYVFRCLMPPQTPACAGTFAPIMLRAPSGCLLNALRPAAVAAGNVETSTRVVDVVLGALAAAVPELIPAASQGTMNNLAMGSSTAGQSWDYYETIGGGMGAGAQGGGLGGLHTHMTNTLNTPVEVLETRFPLRIEHYGLRRGSGGDGVRRGGDGLVREYRFLAATEFTLLTERRARAPWGIAGGEDGAAGLNLLNDRPLPGKYHGHAQAGDLLRIETPGGGGWGDVRDLR